jgi:hypothetical protein
MRLEEQWNGYDFGKSSLAVVAANKGKDGVVVWVVGGHLRMEMEEHGLSGLSELGLDDVPSAGIWVWEGKYEWSPGYFVDDGMSIPVGTWRAPTPGEWAAIMAGRCPWNDEDWRLVSSDERGDGK